MAASKGPSSPVNLRERIAALQQLSASPNTHQSAQATQRGLPSAGTGGLRDKIAKFEEKGGVPVPRGSFAMGAPQPAETVSPKKRGELYGNRVPGLGRPSGAPVSRSGSSQPSTDESPGPRKRCISTGAALSGGPSNLSTDEPVPALPNGLSAFVPRRNSLAVSFGLGRRVMSTSDAEGKAVEFVDALSLSLSSPVPEKPPETTGSQPPSPESAVEPTPLEAEEPRPCSPEAPEITLQSLEPPPVVEQPLPPDSGTFEVDAPEDPPAPPRHPIPVHDASEDVSQSPTVEQSSSNDGHSDHEPAPQPATSQPCPALPEPTSSSAPADTPSTTSITPARAETVDNLSTSPPEEVAASQSAVATSAPDPTAPAPPSIPTPNPATKARSQSNPTFKAVVHRKVTELPAAPAVSELAPHATPRLTQQRRGVSGNVVNVPPSSGFGDLAVLLEDAALLEMRLTEGDGPSLEAKELLAATPTCATFRPDARHASASTLAEHTPMPSVGSGSLSVRSVSIPSIREPSVDGDIPEGDETDGRSLASTTFSQRSPPHRKYLSSIYRLANRRSSSYISGAYPRDSMSMSSEDSFPVTTPSDSGKRKGFGIAWPSTSPKRDGPNVGRSSSFADKIFNRNRTKSNVSTADQEHNSLYESSQPSLALSFPGGLLPETRLDSVDMGAPPTSWISPGDSNSEFSPASSPLDKDIFDAFPSVPQTLPPGFYLDAENAGPLQGRKQVDQRLSMV